MDLSSLFAALDQLVLERLEDGRFVRRGLSPRWCASLMPLTGTAPFAVAEVFPFLEVLVREGEGAWAGRTSGPVYSDFWTEMGEHDEPMHLEAVAVRLDGARALVIGRNERHYRQEQLVLQRARELDLTHRALMREIELKDVLLHAIVHDLAAPLHSVLGALSLLEEALRGTAHARWLAVAMQSATRQRQLIAEILEVFVAEHGALAMPPVSEGGVDVRHTVAQLATEIGPLARQRDIRLELDVERAGRHVVADAARLLRVLTNLVSNAFRHSPVGGVVRVAATPEASSLLLAVEDQGPGVPREALPRLFEKFGRGHDQASGTGLGLYFCRITVEGWGGGIGYEARREGGARFWIRLPLAEEGRHGQAALAR